MEIYYVTLKYVWLFFKVLLNMTKWNAFSLLLLYVKRYEGLHNVFLSKSLWHIYIYFPTAKLMCWLFIEILQVYFNRTEKISLRNFLSHQATHKQVFICVDEQIYFQNYFIKCTLLFISFIKNVMFCCRCFRAWHMGLESQCVIPLVKVIYETSRLPVSCALC